MPEALDKSSILDPRQNDTSLFLDLCRYVAAQAVCVGHAVSFFALQDTLHLRHVPYIQNVGVIVFFVLSGFVIAHVLITGMADDKYGLGAFMIERTARIYSAYLPALVLIVAIDSALLYTVGFEFEKYLGWPIFIGNVVFLQNYLGPIPGVPGFGSAGHLWSLALEFHIYLFVGACFFAAIGRRWRVALPIAILSAPMPMAFFSGQSHGLPGTGLFILWLLGFAAYCICRMGLGRQIPAAVLFCGAVIFGGLWMRRTTPGSEYEIQNYAILFLAFMFAVLVTQRTQIFVRAKRLRKWIRFGANYSFSLYLIHHSILYAFSHVWPESGGVGAFGGVVVSNIAAVVFAYFTEFRHKELAARMKAWAMKTRIGVSAPEPAVDENRPDA